MDGASKDDALEVPDSTDWLETPLRSLAQVDSALRCQVCRDFYTTPMITSCSHTFCSLCIRRSLNNDGKCPACRAPEQAMKLRNNNAMEDLVDAFKRARPDVLAFARTPTSIPTSSASKRSLEEVDDGGEDMSPQKRRRSERTKSSSQKVISVADSDEEYTLDDTIPCPICEQKVVLAHINKHIDDGCPEEPRVTVTKSLSRSSRSTANPTPSTEKPSARPERLAQISYSMIKDNPLRKKLTDAGLSAAGNRQLLERRYTEWVTLWNANCDATKPKSKADLKRELDIWERTQGGRATVSSATQMGSQIRNKDFNGKGWATDYSNDFQQLIANARRNTKAPSSAPTPSEPAESTTPDAGLVTDTPDVDTVMTERQVDAPIMVEDTPEKLASQTRFFHETNSEPPPSSQYQEKLEALEADAGLASNIATVRPMQP
ncbi:DNA repair protein rad18 [Mollisia scopiformis]|uniref:Postreplication repair E3 ubiquitin-protein ligase RAD18 n=1 Tax=Mollisia scopiformis TaxID=149040 RepID=A0A132B570_MOLSC|nr:DNA repair protein rad18 [Mollisia scopiformis]KUJ07034.1 DNA repair protein rad18 [Mollisia scopiformis]